MFKNLILFIAVLTKVVILMLIPSINSDLGYYFDLAQKMMNGLIPYVNFKFEYPPLAILPIWLPALLRDTLFELTRESYISMYRFLFFSLDLAFIFYMKSRFEEKSHFVRFLVVNILLTVGLGPLIYDRLDLAFGLIIFAVILSLSQSEKMRGLFFSLVGIPFKLISLIFVPFIIVSFFQEKDFKLKSFVNWILVPFLAFSGLIILLFQFKFLSFLQYHHTRGIQIESIWATFHFLLKKAAQGSMGIEYSFGAQHLTDVSPWLLNLANYSVMISLICLFFFYLFKKIPLPKILITSLLVFLGFSKVFSPQFLIWFIPLTWFFIEDKIELTLFVIISLLTTSIFVRYGDLMHQVSWAWWTLVFRNLLMFLWMGIRFQRILKCSNRNYVWKDHLTFKGIPSQE